MQIERGPGRGLSQVPPGPRVAPGSGPKSAISGPTHPPQQKNSRVTVPLKQRAVLYEKLQQKAICVLNGVIIAISQYRYHAVSHT